MAIKFKDVLVGLGTEIIEDTEEREESVRETFRLSYADSLEQARAQRQKRRQKEDQLVTIGNALKGLGMNDSQALTVLNSGPEVASKYLEDLMNAKRQDENFDVNSFVTATEDAGLTLDEGIKRMMGTLDVQTGQAFKSPVEGNIFISPQKIVEREQQQLESAFGEDFATIQAEARGQYKRGEIPVGEINLSALYTKEEQEQARYNELRLKEIEARIKALDDPKEMSISQEQSALGWLQKRYLQALELGSGVTLPRSASGEYITPSKENTIATQIFQRATQQAMNSVDLIKTGSTDFSGAFKVGMQELGVNPNVVTDTGEEKADDAVVYDIGDTKDGVTIEKFEGVTDAEFSAIKSVIDSQAPGLSGSAGENILYNSLLERLQKVVGRGRAKDLAEMYSTMVR